MPTVQTQSPTLSFFAVQSGRAASGPLLLVEAAWRRLHGGQHRVAKQRSAIGARSLGWSGLQRAGPSVRPGPGSQSRREVRSQQGVRCQPKVAKGAAVQLLQSVLIKKIILISI